MKHSNLFFLLIVALLLGGSYSLAGATVDTPDNSDAPAAARQAGDSGFLTGPNEGEPLDIALEYLEKNSASLGLTSDDVADVVVTDQYTSKHNGVTHIYLRQRHQGIEVFDANLNINIAADGSVINVGHSFVADLAKGVNTRAPSLSATQAVESAAEELNLNVTEPLSLLKEVGGAANEVLLSDGGISLNDIPVKLMYQSYRKEVRLAWNVSIYELDAKNWWQLRIDAETSKVLDKNNWVIHDEWGESPEVRGDDATSESTTCSDGSGSNDYCVYGMPVESPHHTSPAPPDDGRTMETAPWNDAPNASPFGWHDTDGANGAEYTITRGNNAHAYEDGNNPGFSPDGGADLLFNFEIGNVDGDSPDTYESAAISNLFYWNNITHDLWYEHGFDEASGNFQENNYGNAGSGSDSVNAEAQDGSGTCNANMATPPDGSNPTMQMYTCGDRDGDLDNGVIVHEYWHGISIRLTGGPGNSSCLDNSEQGGEGWSDWGGLMMTIQPGDTGADSRGIGTWLLGEGPNGGGVRTYPYSTDMSINPHTYDAIKTAAVPHGVGSVWAAMIWEMNWALIDEHGFNSDLYAPWNTGGNNLAMQLVIDGLKLQPCSPGFVDARDAILLADQNLTGGANQCPIWEAFAKRGLGFSADQGSSNSATDGSEAFDIPPACETLALAPETQNICVGDTAGYTVSVGQAFTPPVTMSATGEPAGSSATFNPNPVTTVPSTTTLTIGDTAGATAGHYPITIMGTDAVTMSEVMGDLNLFDGNPTTVTLSLPSDGATGVSRAPTFEWNAASGAQSYDIEVATDSDFSNIVYSASSESTSHTASSSLSPLTTYYWRVRAMNPCGDGSYSALASFATEDIPPILVVDDDNNSPDVQSSYTDVLDALGQSYDVWDTNNSDNEPDASYLAPYDMVIWFTGSEYGAFAGPASDGETALGSYLDSGKCLFISSQEYHYDRGLTPFMQDYLGVAFASDDVGQTTVTGDGTVFSGLGPYDLTYPFTNYSDIITPDGTAELAFSGDQGDAAVNKDSGVYRSTFWGFPFEALPTATEQQTAMQTIVDWCGTGVATGTLAGTVTDLDSGDGIAGATISADNGNIQRVTTTDANGNYTVTLAVDTYDLIASATSYLSDTVSTVVIMTDTTTTQDFVLQGSSLTYEPDEIEESMEIGDVVTTTVTLSATGPLDVDFSVNIGNFAAPGVQLVPHSPVTLPASDGNFPRSEQPASVELAPAPSAPLKYNSVPDQTLREMLGAPAYGIEFNFETGATELSSFDTDSPESLNVIGTISPFGEPYPAADFLNGEFGVLYALNDGTQELVAIDTATSSVSVIGPSVPDSFESWTGMAGDPTTGEMYASSADCGSSSTLHTIDVTTGAPTLVGPITNAPCIAAIAINGSGELYGLDIDNDTLLWIDKATGEGTEIGSIGFDAFFSQGMDFDEESGILYLAAFDFFTFTAELRIADTTTGNTTPVGPLGTQGPIEMGSMAIATGGMSGSPWASAVPDSGIVPAGESMTFDVVFDARSLIQVGDHTAELSFSGNFVNDVPTMPLTMQLSCSTCGFLDGEITDLATGDPVNAQLHITSTNGFDVMLSGEGYEIAVQPGSYNFTVSANGYLDQSVSVVATQGTTVTTDFVLTPTIAMLEYTPAQIEEDMEIGDVVSNTVTVENTGYVDLEFSARLGGYEAPGVQLVPHSPVTLPASDGKFPRSEQPASIKPAPAASAPVKYNLAPDQTLREMLGASAYGIQVDLNIFTTDFSSFDTDTPESLNVIETISPFGEHYPAADFLNGDFATLYALNDDNQELVAIDSATGSVTVIGPSVPDNFEFWTGMAGDPTTGMMYASSTDCASSTLYTIDVTTGAPTLVGPITNAPCIIGIAINAAGELYGLDIINDTLLSIDKATGEATEIGFIGFDAAFSQGMDFDEESGILYLAAYDGFTAELRIADTTTGNTTPVGPLGTPGAIEMTTMAIATGGMGGSAWASAVPDSGIVPAGSTMTFDVVFDARSLIQVGDHTAELSFSGNFVNDVPTMPLTMHLSCPTCGILDGQITDLATGDPVNAQLHVTSTNGFDAMLSGDSYQIAVQPGTYNFMVSANGYIDQSASVVATQGTTVTTDFVLTPTIAMLEYTPAQIEESMEIGDVVSNTVTVTNPGYVDLEFNVSLGGYDRPATKQAAELSTSCTVVNHNFESGDFSGWTTVDGGGSWLVNDGTYPRNVDGATTPPLAGNFSALVDQFGPGINILYQDITLPATLPSLIVSWTDEWENHAGVFDDTQQFRVELYGPGGTPFLGELFSTQPGDPVLSEPTTREADITALVAAYAGQSVRLQFVEEDNLSFFNVQVDDVQCQSTGTSWASASPITGTVPAGESMTFDVVFDARSLIEVGDHTAELSFSGNFVNDVPTMPLTMHLSCPTCGFLDGDITDLVTGDPVNAQLHITNTNGFDAMLSGDSYQIAVQPGTYNFTVSANGYFDESATVVATGGTTVTTDFVLTPTIAMLEYTPAQIEEAMQIGDVVSNPVTVTNPGYVDLEFNVRIRRYDGPSVQLVPHSPVTLPASDGNFPRSEQPLSAKLAPSAPVAAVKHDSVPDQTLREMLGAPAYGIALNFGTATTDLFSFDTDSPENLNVIGTMGPFGEHYPAADFLNGEFGVLYALNDGTQELVAIDTATSSVSVIGPSVPDSFESWTGMAGDPTTGEMYASSADCGSSSTLHTIDVTTGAPTLVGPITNAPCIAAIAINGSGELYGLDIDNDTLLWIDKATGEGTEIGSIGFDAFFSQGMDFDEESGILYLAAFDFFTFTAELRIADTTTGNTTPVGPLGTQGPIEMGSMAIATGGMSGSAWASAVPDSGIVPAGESMTFDVVFDSSELVEPGEYTAELSFSGNFVNDPGIMPLSMTLEEGDPPVISDTRTTNVRDVAFTISWLTDVASSGEVHYGTDPNNLDLIAEDVRGANNRDDTHYVLLPNLSPETTYYFDVVSGSTTDDNDGAHYSVTTGPILGVPGSDTIFGQVFKADGTTPAAGAIVYMTLQDNDGSGTPGQSALISALTDNDGFWTTNLGNARTEDLSAYFGYSASGDQLFLEAQGGADGTAAQTVDTADDKPAEPMLLTTMPTPTPTPTATVTPSPTASLTPSPTPTVHPSQTASVTPTPTGSVTPSATASVTPSATASVTPTPTGSVTPTATASVTPTPTGSVTPTPTGSVTPTPTGSVTPTPTASVPGVEISPDMAMTDTVGSTVNYTLQVTNTGNLSDTFDLAVSGETWTTNVSPDSVSLNADASTMVTVSVQIPANAADGESDTATLAATSQADSTVSEQVQLTTTGLINDGVSDEVENGAPNNGDGNNDGIPDSQQEHVTSLPSGEDNQGYVTLESPAGTLLVNVEARPASEMSTMPTDTIHLEMGVFDFMINEVEVGGSVVLTLTLHHTDTLANSYWKYGPEPGNSTDHWYEFNFDSATGTGAVINGNTITLHFVDGQRGDHDLLENGQIIDPGAPAMRQAPLNVSLATFDEQTTIPSPQAGLVLLLTLMAGAGLILLRKRQKGTSTTT